MTFVRPRLRLDISGPQLRGLVVAIGLAVLLGACGSAGSPTPSGATSSGLPSPEPGAFPVVATTTVLADMVAQVGREKVAVSSLVPRGGEVHTYDPSPGDLSTVEGARLIVMNGLGLDDWLADVIESSGSGAPIVALAEGLEGVDYLAGDEGDSDGEAYNPHLWLNVRYAMKYVERIRDALKTADPDDAATYDANAAAYLERLAALDASVAEQIGAIPEADRRIVSFHEAFPYFADAYGLEIVGVVVDAPGQDPSAGEIAALVDAIRASGAKAVFSEAQFSPELAQTIADEAGVAVESNLYNDSLGDPPVDTYEGLIRWDVERIVAALR